ncbi:hypothetical protein NTE_00216 [Candidatus Nitrososphaera evergladensis SR1]|uniref:Uncharacterized protein n=1 Tax=Candidatus Nitrososphaera evergladensis SR1 TaxID=1459636 RepID=A0A075MM29_9ARCH|nr:hypothetical protein [Candidatus Nitrososphaera evergladensis]AIF82298.1 hypothetical protein NTE_00216 [Candidatus Nitrososphaera evergladensis SR1]
MNYENEHDPSIIRVEKIRTAKPKIMDLVTIRKMWGRSNKLPICNYCGKLISLGDAYFYHSRRKKARKYHWDCAKRINLV